MLKPCLISPISVSFGGTNSTFEYLIIVGTLAFMRWTVPRNKIGIYQEIWYSYSKTWKEYSPMANSVACFFMNFVAIFNWKLTKNTKSSTVRTLTIAKWKFYLIFINIKSSSLKIFHFIIWINVAWSQLTKQLTLDTGQQNRENRRLGKVEKIFWNSI